MIKIEHTTVTGWEAALRRSRQTYRKRDGRFEVYASDAGRFVSLGTYLAEDEAIEASVKYRYERLVESVIRKGLIAKRSAIVFDKYIAFETGQILNLHGKEMIGMIDQNGYHEIILAGKLRRVHRVIAEAFVPKVEGKEYVNHIDGNKLNNAVSNLEWVTNSENLLHAYRLGLERKVTGEQHHAHKLSWEIVKEIRDTYIPRDKKFGAAAIARRIGVDRTTIAAVVNNECWREMA